MGLHLLWEKWMTEMGWEMYVLMNHSFSCRCGKKGKMWMRAGNSFPRYLLVKFEKLKWISVYTLSGHNSFSTKSRPDALFRSAGFLFLLINALQLLLLKPEAFLVFSRESAKFLLKGENKVMFWPLFCERVASAEFWLFVPWIYFLCSQRLQTLGLNFSKVTGCIFLHFHGLIFIGPILTRMSNANLENQRKILL